MIILKEIGNKKQLSEKILGDHTYEVCTQQRNDNSLSLHTGQIIKEMIGSKSCLCVNRLNLNHEESRNYFQVSGYGIENLFRTNTC